MSFADTLENYSNFDFDEYFQNIQVADILQILKKDKLSDFDFLALLSDKAKPFLETMARKAHDLTVRNFGKVIQLYIPLYISDYCTNECVYCGFKNKNPIERKKLTQSEIEINAEYISRTNIKHIIILTGEAPEKTPMSYLTDTVNILKKYFSSITIEIFPMDVDEYVELKNAGVDGLTIYQEVYDRTLYAKVHKYGKKTDYNYRLDTPERGAMAGFRAINIGALLGLGDPVKETFFSGIHARYLQNKYTGSEISISLPRLNEAEGGFTALHPLDDAGFVQFILAYRLFMPKAGITISTRERADLRNNLIPLGITKMSAGSVTSVGGYATPGTPQFEINDNRSAAEISSMIKSKGYDPVFKDWDII